jgi:exosortase A
VSGLSILLVIYAGTSASLFAAWSNDPLGHGYLILPASIYLAWTRRSDLVGISPRPAFWLLPILALVSVLWLAAAVTSTTMVEQFCLTALFVGFIWGALGTAAAHALALPLGLLVFALPIGDVIVPTLQRLTALLAVAGLRLTGVPVLLQSEVITIPGSSWEVAKACSGINYLMSALMMAYLYAALVYRSWNYRIGFVLAAAPLALLANAIRVYVTILIASSGAPEVTQGHGHTFLGWLVYGAILAAMLAVASRFTEEQASSSGSAGPAVQDAAPALSSQWGRLAGPVFVVVGLMVVAVAPIAANRVHSRDDASRDAVLPRVSVQAPWTPVSSDVTAWSPRANDATLVATQTFVASQPVKLHVSVYDAATAAAKVGTSENALWSPGWREAGSRAREVTLGGRVVSVRETRLESAAASLVVWSWYRIGNSTTSSSYVAKMLLAERRLTGRTEPSLRIAIAVRDLPEADPARVLQEFTERLTIE